MQYRISKIERYGTYTSEKIGVQRYYTVYAHLYTDDVQNQYYRIFTEKSGKRYYRVHFIFFIDSDDIYNYCYDEDTPVDAITADDIKRTCIDSAIAYSECYIAGAASLDDVLNTLEYTINRYGCRDREYQYSCIVNK